MGGPTANSALMAGGQALASLGRRGAAGLRGRGRHLAASAVIVLLLAACGSLGTTAQTESASRVTGARAVTEYVGGHWIPFTARHPLDSAQWAVVDAYANFSSAALAVFETRSVAALATVASAQSGVTKMFARDLAAGRDPEALYTRATVEAVAIRGCRASLTLELYYPGGRSLRYQSSWVRPFDRAPRGHGERRRADVGSSPSRAATAEPAIPQHAPWQFVGDNRVGGLDAPCGL